MKKYILLVLFMVGFVSIALGAPVVVQSYNSPNDVTVTNLETNQNAIVDGINSFDGSLIQVGSISSKALDANASAEERWGRAFGDNDWVFTGLLPPTASGTLTTTTTAGSAFITNDFNQQKFVQKDATANTYTASKWTYLDLNSGGTYTYVETGISTAEPATTAESIRLARVSSSPTEISAVRDDRPLAIQLSNQEDQYREGFSVTVVSPAALTAQPGITFNGTTRIVKTADTVLDLGTAADWATGVSGRAVSTKGYVVINPNGSIKLTTTAPTLTDTSENAAGELRYSVISSVNWRALSWFWMNADGSGNTNPQLSGKWPDNYLPGDTVQVVNYQTGDLATGTTALPNDDTPPQITEGDEYMTLEIVPTSTTNKLRIDIVLNAASDVTGDTIGVALFQATTVSALAATSDQSYQDDAMKPIGFTHYMTTGTISATRFRVRAGDKSGATVTFNGRVAGRLFWGLVPSSITITEIKQ